RGDAQHGGARQSGGEQQIASAHERPPLNPCLRLSIYNAGLQRSGYNTRVIHDFASRHPGARTENESIVHASPVGATGGFAAGRREQGPPFWNHTFREGSIT